MSHRLVRLASPSGAPCGSLSLGIWGCVAWALVNVGIEQMFPLAALLAVVVTLIGIYSPRTRVQRAGFRRAESSSFAPLLKDLTFRARRRVMPTLVRSPACYYFCVPPAFEGESLDHFRRTHGVSRWCSVAVASLYGSGCISGRGIRSVSVTSVSSFAVC